MTLSCRKKRKKRLARGDPGINRLDRIAKAHDMDYDKTKNLKDKWAADLKMIAKIDQLPGSKSLAANPWQSALLDAL